MASNVYVFNLFSERVGNLTVNGYPAGDIGGYAQGGGVPVYTPASRSVPRTKFAGDSTAFAIGDNSLVIGWDSFRGSTTITIPGPAGGVSLDDPLILLLAVNNALLLTTRGYVLSSFPVQLGHPMQVATEPDQD
ncbi:MAG TPA: hypothetical protein VFU36_06885 [Jatrophihabitans sp.]|nr:hypothetical protein [Jatrophihabitans sp.]